MQEQIIVNTIKMNITNTHIRKRRAKFNFRESKDVVNETGESSSLLKHFDELRQDDESNASPSCGSFSPYDNAPWDINKHYETVDLYEIVVMAINIIPQLAILYPLLYLTLLVPVGINLLYAMVMLPPHCEVIPRTTSWRLHCVFQAVLCIPAALIALFRQAFFAIPLFIMTTKKR